MRTGRTVRTWAIRCGEGRWGGARRGQGAAEARMHPLAPQVRFLVPSALDSILGSLVVSVLGPGPGVQKGTPQEIPDGDLDSANPLRIRPGAGAIGRAGGQSWPETNCAHPRSCAEGEGRFKRFPNDSAPGEILVLDQEQRGAGMRLGARGLGAARSARTNTGRRRAVWHSTEQHSSEPRCTASTAERSLIFGTLGDWGRFSRPGQAQLGIRQPRAGRPKCTCGGCVIHSISTPQPQRNRRAFAPPVRAASWWCPRWAR